jgi:hypothetical protein
MLSNKQTLGGAGSGAPMVTELAYGLVGSR